jgi:hypothetical protein
VIDPESHAGQLERRFVIHRLELGVGFCTQHHDPVEFIVESWNVVSVFGLAGHLFHRGDVVESFSHQLLFTSN